MIFQLKPFLHELFISLVALFPVINPIGSALIVNPYLSQLPDEVHENAVRKITIYAFCICIVTLFAGHLILELFGITIPVIQVAGGTVICKMGWDTLSSGANNQSGTADMNGKHDAENEVRSIKNNLFYPLTFPITTGAGTMSVLFTLSAHSADANWKSYLVNSIAIILAIVIMCAAVYLLYKNSGRITKKLGVKGQNIANRIIAFLIFCVGIEIASTGLKSLF